MSERIGREAGPGMVSPAPTRCVHCRERLATPPHVACPECIEAGYITGPHVEFSVARAQVEGRAKEGAA